MPSPSTSWHRSSQLRRPRVPARLPSTSASAADFSGGCRRRRRRTRSDRPSPSAAVGGHRERDDVSMTAPDALTPVLAAAASAANAYLGELADRSVTPPPTALAAID